MLTEVKIASIKLFGLWDRMSSSQANTFAAYINTEVAPAYKNTLVPNKHVLEGSVGICLEDVLKYVKAYFVSSNYFPDNVTDFRAETGVSDTRVCTNDALELLLRAPMLVDLTSWSCWDYKFAPSLGPLVGWLLSYVTTKELLCLVTKDGKVLRIDHLATVDSFLDAFLHGSSFGTALNLVSLISLYGGERNVPLSLLKCHAKNSFEIMFENSSSIASRFVLDCLGCIPKEFRSFAGELLVSAFRSITKDAYMLIISECKRKEDRMMIHELGFSLGVVEWIDDHCSFLSESNGMIISKLCASNCLLLEGETDKWVPPCQVLRNWNDHARTLLPDSLIHKHLGLGYLNRDMALSDTLARALGIMNYGPKVLVDMISSICHTKEGLTSMDLNWLSSLLNELYLMSLQNPVEFKAGSDVMNTLTKTPFIPLLDDSYGAINEVTENLIQYFHFVAFFYMQQIRSAKLVTSIGFKSTVTLHDALLVLEFWKRFATSFKASISQMSRFYSFIWKELVSSDHKSIANFSSGPFIFVPLSSVSSSEVVSGILLSPKDMYWHDNIINTDCEESKMLSNLYPSFHDFFVNGCGVKENPSLLDYLSFLHRLSTVNTPLKAAKKV
ncbi:hypothetical protein HanPI659440_Chr02g0093251 [Helianthus annuus]|nr:hypothetical protein HanPI659440_Chr02g0093251 [Helianthus annuus]